MATSTGNMCMYFHFITSSKSGNHYSGYSHSCR